RRRRPSHDWIRSFSSSSASATSALSSSVASSVSSVMTAGATRPPPLPPPQPLPPQLLPLPGRDPYGSSSAQALLPPTPLQPTSLDGPWPSLAARVLPLFNGEGLRGSIEEINELVRLWATECLVQQRRSAQDDLNELCQAGVRTLGAKIAQASDETLLPRLVELWAFVFCNVAPYLESAFLPLRAAVASAAANGTLRGISAPISIRTVVLGTFRDALIVPLAPRLEDIFPRLFIDVRHDRRLQDIASRLVQLLCVLQGLPGGDALRDERPARVRALLLALRETLAEDDSDNFLEAPPSLASAATQVVA
ncbi:hypothetical protein HK405_014472, partial [Cladochytrium tenue]